jgi:hypothetical protein
MGQIRKAPDGHRVEMCIHGIIVLQCRCPERDKPVVIVECPPECEPVVCGFCGRERKRCLVCGRVCDCGRLKCKRHDDNTVKAD